MGKVDALLADVRGFMKSRIILTAAELDLFTQLDEAPYSAEGLALKLGLDGRATTRLLDCLATMDLLEKQDSVYRLTENGVLYSSHHPETVLPMVLHMNRLWDTWSDLSELVKNGGHFERKPGLHMDDEAMNSFIGAMHVVGRELAQEVVDDYDATRFKRLMDIGGASGTYTIAFLRKNPMMTAVLFDLENVIPMARERLAENLMDHRVDLVAGDFYQDDLPKGCDLALLSAIIHQNSPDENLSLYRKIYEALEPGGALLIRDYIMDDSRTKPPPGAMFAINMLVNTRAGDTYTFQEMKEVLEAAGFRDVQQVRQGVGMDSLIEGRKPM